MKRIKILGIGSPFGGDVVGWNAAQALERYLNQYPEIMTQVQIECHDRPGYRLIELMNDADVVFLLDAVQSNNKAGTLHRLMDHEIYDLKNLLSTHDLGLAQTLQLAEALNAMPEKVILYGIEMDIQAESEMTSLAIDELCIQITQEVILICNE